MKMLTTISGRAAMMIGLSIFFFWSSQLRAEDRLSGFFSAADESGIWYLSVLSTGACEGYGWSEKYQDTFSLGGTVKDDHVEFYLGGYTFNGLISRESGMITGGWTDIYTNTGGRMTGSLVNPEKMAPYAGEFSGSYTGSSDSGTWNVLLFTDGHCEGEFRSDKASFDEPALKVNGGFNASGQIVWEASNNSMRYAMKANVAHGYITGNWYDSQARTNGTFSGNREDALPAEVTDPNGGSSSSSGCFIRTIAEK